jgi:hypothetical protein
MRPWIFFAFLQLSVMTSVTSYFFANPSEAKEEKIWGCGLTGNGEFKAVLMTSQREPAGFDATRYQSMYLHSFAHQHRHLMKVRSL